MKNKHTEPLEICSLARKLATKYKFNSINIHFNSPSSVFVTLKYQGDSKSTVIDLTKLYGSTAERMVLGNFGRMDMGIFELAEGDKS